MNHDSGLVKLHQCYLELCCCLAKNNRMGILIISKNTNFERLKNIVSHPEIPYRKFFLLIKFIYIFIK